MTAARSRIHEVDFCSQIAGAANELVSQAPSAYPFAEARVEGFGTGASKRQRKDLRFVDGKGMVVLCGEVKRPGTPERRSALHHNLVKNAALKADDAGIQYFFTWNVNEFALWDRSLWERPWFERRVRFWRLERVFANSEEVGQEESLRYIKKHFLPWAPTRPRRHHFGSAARLGPASRRSLHSFPRKSPGLASPTSSGPCLGTGGRGQGL